MLMFLVFGAVGLLCIVLGAVVRFKRAWWLINGINTSTEERRAKMDLDAICIWTGTALMIGGALFILGGLLSWLVNEMAFLFMLPVFLFVILGAFLYVRRFDGNNFDENGKIKQGKTALILAATLLPLVVVAILIIPGFRETSVTIEGDTLTIHGAYGLTVHRGDIASVELVDNYPRMTRVNGIGTGTQLKGHVSGPGGRGRAYLKLNNPPYIHLVLREGTNYVYLNLGDPGDTRALHQQITAWRR